MSESNTNNSISQSVSSQYPSSLSDKNTLNNNMFDSVTQSLSQITTSVFSMSQPSSTNTTLERHKHGNTKTVIIPPPPGIKPPIVRRNSQQSVQSVNDNTINSVGSSFITSPQNIVHSSLIVPPNNAEINTSLCDNQISKQSNSANALGSENNFIPVKNQLSSITSSFSTKQQITSMTNVNNENTGSTVSTLHIPVLSVSKSNNSGAFKSNVPILSSSYSLVSLASNNIPTTRPLSSILLDTNSEKKQSCSNKNPFISAAPDKIKTVRFADRYMLPSKYENMSLPDLSNIPGFTDSSSDESDFDLSASYTSLNPFSLDSTSTKTKSFKINASKSTHFIHSITNPNMTSSLSASKSLSNINKTNKNPFYTDNTGSNNTLFTNDSSEFKLGNTFFTSLLITKSLSDTVNEKDIPKTMSECKVRPATSESNSILNKVSSANANTINNITNASNLLPPMKSSSTESKPNGESTNVTNTEFPVMSNSNASGDLSQLKPLSGGQKSAEEQKTSGDRYAALKDLDDMFKSTVLSEGIQCYK